MTATATGTATSTQPTPVIPQRKVTPRLLIGQFLFTGYIFWSWYFGLAAACRWVLAQLPHLTTTWIAVGCLAGISAGWFFFAMYLVVAILGGGLY
ncbi:MAG TPA: hypothetical protein VF432_29225 [Thermoanaerobaculia bacterium]